MDVLSQDFPTNSFGIKAGSNSTWFGQLSENNNQDGLKFGYHFGIWSRFKLSPNGFYIQPEIIYSLTGAKSKGVHQATHYDNEGGSFPVTLSGGSDISVSSISVPILFGKTFKSNQLNFRTYLGFVPGYITDAKEKSHMAIPELNQNYAGTYTLNNSINRFQAKGQIGIGLDISRFSFDLNYQNQLTNFYKNDTKYKINGFSASIGIRLF